MSESIVFGIVNIDSYGTNGLGSVGVWIHWLLVLFLTPNTDQYTLVNTEK